MHVILGYGVTRCCHWGKLCRPHGFSMVFFKAVLTMILKQQAKANENSVRCEKGKPKLRRKGAQTVSTLVKIIETFAHQGNANLHCM